MVMDYQAIIDKYYPTDNELRRLLIKHSRQVADRALAICRKHRELPVDMQFLEEAAMLHDIGIYQCDAARVAERHTGTGLAGFEPETLEEQVVCYADKFYSKSNPDHVRSVLETAQSLEKFGHAGVEKFLAWAKKFE